MSQLKSLKRKVYKGCQILCPGVAQILTTNFKCTLDHIMIVFFLFFFLVIKYLIIFMLNFKTLVLFGFDVLFIRILCLILKCPTVTVHKRPRTNKTHHLVKYNSATGQITCGMWHVTCQKYYLTCYMILHVPPWRSGTGPATHKGQ